MRPWCALGAFILVAAPVPAAGPSRPLQPQTVAWWTFDTHLRDEVRGLVLVNDGNENPEHEKAYGNPYQSEVPLLDFSGHTNWRTYYRWLGPNVTYCRVGRELDVRGPFTVEAYINPRHMDPLQPRAYLVRKRRVDEPGATGLQWCLEMRRRPDNRFTRHDKRADLWAMVAFQKPDNTVCACEVTARDAVRLTRWQRIALIHDGHSVGLYADGELAASVPAPGPGAVPLPTETASELLVSNLACLADGSPIPSPEKLYLRVDYSGRIDELRISRGALTPEQFLPAVKTYGDAPLAAGPRRTEYTSIVRRHLDLLMAHAVDRYGPSHSPLIGSTLDPGALKMVTRKPPGGIGMPKVEAGPYRSPMLGCNLTHLRTTHAAMRALSDITGDERYGARADTALRFWLDNCLFASGVWPIGEHGVWNFYTDKPEPTRPHEPQAHLDWPLYFAIAPEKVVAEIDAMHIMHIFEHRGLAHHGRHGNVVANTPKHGGCGFIRLTGLFARAWAFLHSRTADPKYLGWVREQAALCAGLRDPKTGFYPTQTYPVPGEVQGGRKYPPAGCGTQPIWAAIGFLDAAAWIEDPATRDSLVHLATDMAMVNLHHYYGWNGTTFSATKAQWMGAGHDPGGAWLVLKVWERLERPQELLELARRIADDALGSWAPKQSEDAGAFAWRILFFVQLHNVTGDDRYLAHARQVGDCAAAHLVLGNGLVGGSAQYRYYDRMFNVPRLLIAFLALDHGQHPSLKTLLRDPMF